MRTVITIVLLILLSSATVSAQADFLDKGVGGLGFAFEYSSYDQFETYLVRLGVTTNGSFEPRLAGGQVSLSGFDYVTIQPSAIYYPLKQKPGQLLTLGFKLGVELNFLGTTTETVSTESKTFYGGVLLTNAGLSRSVWLQPAFSVTNVSGVRSDIGRTIIGLSLSIITKLSPNTLLRLRPTVAFADGDQTFSFTLGFILPEISD